MRSVRSILLLAALLVTLFVTGGCGDKTAVPTAPTPVAETPASSTVTTAQSTVPSPGATIAGTITMPAGTGAFGARAITTTVFVQVAGTDLSAIVGAQGNFELRGVPAGDVTLCISGMGIDASVAVGILQAGEAVQLAIVVSGTVALISADSRLGHGQPVETEGAIAEVQPPNRIVVRSQLVEVTGRTVITRDHQVLKYADLYAGQRVHVRGTVNVTVSSTIVVADVIEVQAGGPTTPTPPTPVPPTPTPVPPTPTPVPPTPTPVPPTPTPTPITFTGTVAAIISGTCGSKNLVFYAGVTGTTAVTKTVQTSASTAFTPSCDDVKVGAKVTVAGQLQAGDIVVSSKVTVVPAPPTPITISGTVSGFVATSCPALTFTVTVTGVTSTTTTVQTSSSTAFAPGCTPLKNGDKVKVAGTKPADTLLATSVTRY